MPISHRSRPPTLSARPPAAVQAAAINRAWPVSILLFASIVFTVFLAQTTLLIALTMAMVAALAGGILLTLMFGIAWIAWIIRLPRLPGRRP